MEKERLYQQIIDAYQEMGSISAVQKRLRVSEVKIRRVLITEGLWSSKTSRQIGTLADKGMSLQEIAETLNATQKAVEACLLSFALKLCKTDDYESSTPSDEWTIQIYYSDWAKVQ